MFAALYAALVVVFAPSSVFPVQIRVADVLMPMAILFGRPAFLGLALGAGVGNIGADALSGFGPSSIGIDAIGGGLANLAAGYIAWRIGRLGWTANGRTCWALGTLGIIAADVVVIGNSLPYTWEILVIVLASGLLAYVIRRTSQTSYAISWPLATVAETIVISLVVGSYLGAILPFPMSLEAGILGVLFGSIIAVNIGGNLLLAGITRPAILRLLESWGVNTFTHHLGTTQVE